MKHVSHPGIIDLSWVAGTENQQRKHLEVMQKILEVDTSPDEKGRKAFAYLDRIQKELWTLAYDGGHRWGIMTTNSTEAFNGVLVGARYLSIKALVHYTF